MDRYQFCAGLSRPFWWSTNVIASLQDPIPSTKEPFCRIGRVAAVVLLSPISIVFKGISELLLFFQSHPFKVIEKKGLIPENKEILTILSWNICGLPGGLPRWFGGVPPLSQRISRVADFLLKEDCDVICLQEAHDVRSTYTLYRKLCRQYKYFYLNIGSKAFLHNSGLFVASKKPLSNFTFTSFKYKGKQFGINKGYCTFDVTVQNKPSIRVATTHLQPYTSSAAKSIRCKELKDITKANPDFICGDLNIDRFRNEEGTEHIHRFYSDSLGEVETATDALIRGHKPSESSSIDYCLVAKNAHIKNQTSIKQAYLLDRPEQALSDHHALISKLKYK